MLSLTLLLSACSPDAGSQPDASSQPSGSQSSSAAAEEKKPVLGDFTATDLEGNEVTQEIFSDKKLTMVNVWATFCDPCLRELPDLGELAQEYADQDFQIVGIVMDTLDRKGEISADQVETARFIVEEAKADYTHLLPSDDLIESYLQYVTGVPTTFFVDSEGKQVGETQQRYWDRESWVSIIESALEEVNDDQTAQ